MTKNTDAVPETSAELAAEMPKDGITTLREKHGVALRLWTTKAPREVGGTISAVFLQDATPPHVVMLHQLNNHKFSVWSKTDD